MVSLLPLLALASAAAAAKSGYLIASENGNRIGCVQSNGKVGVSGCASFTLTDDYRLLTGSSQCRALGSNEPLNTDANYGPGLQVTALGCGPQYVQNPPPAESLFYLGPQSMVPLCTFNQNCAWDLKATPTAGTSVHAWPYFYVSINPGPAPGHPLVSLVFRDTPQ